MDKVLGNKKAIMIFVLPALILFVAIVIVPLFISFYYSTFDWNGFGDKIGVGLGNYSKLITDKWFVKSLGNSAILTLLTLVIQLPIAIILALVLSTNIKGEGFFRTIFFVPVMLSAVVIGHLFRRIYDVNDGLLNSLLQNIGLTKLAETSWLGTRSTALYAAIVPIIWQWVGYHMLLLYAAAKSVPKELREAAKLDGANGFQVATKVVLPLMAPVIKICAVILVIGSLREFDMIFTMTGGGPVHASEMPSTIMISTLFSKYQYGYGSAMAVFIVIECLLITLVIQKIFKTADVTY